MGATVSALLSVRNLTTRFHLVNQTVTAVDGISFDVEPNEILAIVGESGSGKSVTLLSVLGLVDPPGEIDPASEILFEGRDLRRLAEEDLTALRGERMGMIFQEPSASFNLLLRMGTQLAEGLRLHRGLDRKEAHARAIELLRQVRVPAPEQRVQDYPFQMSGGMLQRAMIAQALAGSPSLLLADEPTTALDVTTQAQILGLLKEKASAASMSVIFVTHDLGLVDGFADRLMIMYAGRIVESGPTREMLREPRHPYTRDLLTAIPRLGVFKDERRLYAIEGRVPEPSDLPEGCKYAPRCRDRIDRCAAEPGLERRGDRMVRCWLA